MKLLFVARHFTYFRNFESVVRQFAEKGHYVHLAAERDESLGGEALVDRLAKWSPLITVGHVPQRSDARWFSIATAIRRSIDHLWYSSSRYEGAPKIRARAWHRTPNIGVLLARLPGRTVIERILDAMDRAIPTDPALDTWIDELNPDVVLLTPLIELGTPQLDLLKSAHKQRKPTVLAVWSWDHLTSKAHIRQTPDRILVWNETQKQEAVTLHGVQPDRVVVTGAQCFDHWFNRRPSRTRESFCEEMGLPIDQPFVLYVCSALFRGTKPEADFVLRWISALRSSSDMQVQDAGILIRPHPQRMSEWEDINYPANVVFKGGHPIDDVGRDDYFDSLYYADAVVGLNTSALIEAAIVDKPVMTVLMPEFHDSQRGTIHFRYLLDSPTPFLHVAKNLDDQVIQLGQVLAGSRTQKNEPFVQAFIRPAGLTCPSTPTFVKAVEQVEGIQPTMVRSQFIWRTLLHAWYASIDLLPVRWLMCRSQVEKEQRRAERIAEKQERIRVREQERRTRVDAKMMRSRTKRRRQRITHLKTVVRRVLTVGGRGGMH